MTPLNKITDPVEKIIADALDSLDIPYTINNSVPQSNRSIDFHLPTYGLYIECKRFASSRLHEQISSLTNVVVIQGMEAALEFSRLLADVYALGISEAHGPSGQTKGP